MSTWQLHQKEHATSWKSDKACWYCESHTLTFQNQFLKGTELKAGYKNRLALRQMPELNTREYRMEKKAQWASFYRKLWIKRTGWLSPEEKAERYSKGVGELDTFIDKIGNIFHGTVGK